MYVFKIEIVATLQEQSTATHIWKQYINENDLFLNGILFMQK